MAAEAQSISNNINESQTQRQKNEAKTEIMTSMKAPEVLTFSLPDPARVHAALGRTVDLPSHVTSPGWSCFLGEVARTPCRCSEMTLEDLTLVEMCLGVLMLNKGSPQRLEIGSEGHILAVTYKGLFRHCDLSAIVRQVRNSKLLP